MVKKATKKSPRKATRTSHTKKTIKIDKNPEFMVQLGDPMVLRKDLLESLREVIIFMQGYEKFRAIQEDKVTLFTSLQSDLKELNNLIDGKLRKLLPKGSLTAVTQKQQLEEFKSKEKVEIEDRVEVVPFKSSTPAAPTTPREENPAPLDDIGILENQLRDIENQLQNLK